MLRRPFHPDHPFGKRYYPAYMIHNENGIGGYKELCKVLHILRISNILLNRFFE